MKKTLLYYDERCVEIVRQDYRKYSMLNMDFIFCEGTDSYLRQNLISILQNYINILRRLPIRNDNLIPFIKLGSSTWVVIGPSTISIRLPSEVIDEIINKEKIVELAKEWCEQKCKQK